MPGDQPSDACRKPLLLRRNLVVFLAVASAFIMCLLRYNLSVAIVAILEDHEETNRNGTVQIRKRYPFSEEEVGQLMASYFYGYVIFQFPAGRLGELFGVKHILGYSTLVGGILSFLTPIMLDFGAIPMILTRCIIGVLHCTVLSCSYTLFNEWHADNNKRSNAITLVNAGFELGGMCSFYLTGLISSSSPSAWRYSFYLFSLTAFVWFIPYHLFVSSKPEDEQALSDYERNLIQQERKIKYQKQLSSILSTNSLIKIPPKLDYKQILTSRVVWASCIAKSACALSYIIIMVKMPAYLHDVFDVSLTQNGLFTALTSAGIMTSKFLCFQLSSYVLGIERFSLTAKRKFFQTIAMLTPAICLTILVLKNDSKELCIFLLVMSMFGNGFVCLGDAPMTAEWAKDLSGSLYGFTNTFACLSAVLAPILCSFVLKNFEDDLFLGWNIVFIISSVFLIVALVIFLLFATSEPCSWAESRFVAVDQFHLEKKEKSAKLV